MLQYQSEAARISVAFEDEQPGVLDRKHMGSAVGYQGTLQFVIALGFNMPETTRRIECQDVQPMIKVDHMQE